MEDNDGRIRHLELIQSAINRMATNAFVLKGWSVTLAAALFALAAKDSNAKLAWVALLPAVAFWSLDAFYLRQERLYRCLYNRVRLEAGTNDPFTLDTTCCEAQVPALLQTGLAMSVVGIHGVIVLAVVLVMFLVA